MADKRPRIKGRFAKNTDLSEQKKDNIIPDNI